ncbi:MAG: hypothetical protein ACK5IQ_09370 [Bacteroidales bacterium]
MKNLNLILILLLATFMACTNDKNTEVDNTVDITKDITALNTSYEALKSRYDTLTGSVAAAQADKNTYCNTDTFTMERTALLAELTTLQSTIAQIDKKAGDKYTASSLDVYKDIKNSIISKMMVVEIGV